MTARALRERFESQDNQRIARQDRDRRSIFAMHGRLAAPDRRIVETRQIIMDQRGAVEKLDRRRRPVGCFRIGIAACPRDRKA